MFIEITQIGQNETTAVNIAHIIMVTGRTVRGIESAFLKVAGEDREIVAVEPYDTVMELIRSAGANIA